MKKFYAIALLASALTSAAQDSLYTRRVIKYLCSRECFGRGYLKGGLRTAENFLVGELRAAGAVPFAGPYSIAFSHPVNTFPGPCRVKLNGRRLVPGEDFILDAASRPMKGKFILQKKDSVTYAAANGAPVEVELKKKLTFSVARQQADICVIEIDKARLKEEPGKLRINISAKQEPSFVSRNIAAYVNGSATDSMLVFTAHYDHLGGLGRHTFFPGANDNASGVSMVLNLAKHFAVHPSKYRCVFILFAGEEAGLLGSAHFVQSGLMDLKKIKFLVNLDLLGTGDDGIMVVNGAVFGDQFNRLTAINESHKLVKEIRKRGKAANSDHYHFTEAGVPAFFIYTLGGTTAYHDTHDVEKTLPLTDYKDIFQLLVRFAESF